ncbi:MAG TPA: CPBP family intramembrane glutamic endopeptidase [Thermomicrobiaceae bacterium]|nr:CPBP family intramembrane glutamic endopeptidase [Thermomicrobiaceae bacterium]
MRRDRRAVPASVAMGALAFVIAVGSSGVWAALVSANLALSPAVPWSVPVTALLLVAMWRYLAGRGVPARTSAARRRLLRARGVSSAAFGWALLAGLLSIAALAGYWIVLVQVTDHPTNVLPDYARYPAFTVAAILVMASLVGGVAEEAAVRGYFQSFLERRRSAAAAILIAALVIAPGHALSQGFLWTTVAFYLGVDVMLGTLAYLTDSIVPGIVVHTLGLLVFFTLVWPGDLARRAVRIDGPDAWFWIHLSQAVVFTGLALLAFRRLAALTGRRTPDSATQSESVGAS